MKKFLCFLAGFLFSVLLCTAAAAQSVNDIENESLLLKSEMALARKPIIYFIFDLKGRVVLLKSRGVVLKQMKIEIVESWGDPVDTKPLRMIEKSALFEPKRVKIDPDKNKEEETETTTTPNPGAFDIEALELKDMPASYHMEFSDGVHISVRPATTGFVSGIYNTASYLGWYTTCPLLTVWNSMLGRPFTSIFLTLSEEDARSIYWSLVENSENIIYLP